jgi:Cu/Zn superoxide dismutase
MLMTLSACGGGAGAATPSPAQSATAAPRQLTFVLKPQNASGAEGSGRVAVSAANSFTVTLTISGLVPNTSHVSHIHKGNCSTIGAVAVALSNVASDARGNASTSTRLEEFPYAVPAEGWYAMVHAGPDLTGTNARAIVCGELPAA